MGVGFGTAELTDAHDRAVVAVRVETGRFAGSHPLIAAIRLTAPDSGEVLENDTGARRRAW